MSLIRGRSHRRKGAVSHIIDMVWLYRSPMPVGMKGSSICSNEDYLPSRRLEERRRESVPCGPAGVLNNFDSLFTVHQRTLF